MINDEYKDYYDEPKPRKQRIRCECFSPGEVSGTCPGPDVCPYANDLDDEGCEQP